MSILDGLNPKQKQAVTTIKGPVLVLAGAGSGKTKTITHRIAYLIFKKKVNPNSILAVTFTNKAAREMMERVGNIIHSESNNIEFDFLKHKEDFINLNLILTKKIKMPDIGTFHSICARILRREAEFLGYSRSFSIFDETDSIRALKMVMRSNGVSPKDTNPKIIKSFIERAKREMIYPEHFVERFNYIQDLFLKDIVSKIYFDYQKFLKESNALDFGDLIFKTIELWSKYPNILKKYQSRWKYVLVDEYQDINYVQYLFCRLVSKNHNNLFVVGDDYQSIYSFRGADIENILRFPKDYRDAEIIKLEQNYRSTKPILDVANIIINKNSNQHKKRLWTKKSGGLAPKIVEVDNEEEEAEFIISEACRINDEIGGQENLNNYVVLYRTNAQSRAIEEVMLKYNIPYRIIGSVEFYQRKEIKDILAYLKLIDNQNDLVSLERIINIPQRGIGVKSWDKFLNIIQNSQGDIFNFKEKYNSINIKFNQNILSFLNLIKSFNIAADVLNASSLIDKIVEDTGYINYLKKTEENFEDRINNIKELKTVANRFSSAKGRDGLRSFLQEIALLSDIDNLDSNNNAITLMTIHSAKGLEFPYVFMVGMEQGLFPHSASMFDEKELEEERRLCYVGITRAKEGLYFIYTRQRRLYGSVVYPEPSEFLEDLDESVVDMVSI